MDWFIILIIVASILSSIANRQKEKRTERRKPIQSNVPGQPRPMDQQPASPFPDFDFPWSDWEEDIEVPKEVSKEDKEKKAEKAEKVEKGFIELKKSTVDEEKGNENKSKSTMNPPFEEIDAEKVIQGFMWSEVFSPPRSRNPHQPLRYFKKN